ncbi:tail connector protein [Aeromonas phage AhyVDH1]|nr:tail connector protein [Aeromonas phage AhyVDH1]
MTEVKEGAPLLRPLVTKQGLLAAIEASTLGKPVKIVNVGITATPGEASKEDQTLPGAVILPVADGRVVNDHQVNVSTLLGDTLPSMDICGIAFYLEDGTMFAVYREPQPFLEHTTGTTLLVGMDLVMDDIPTESVIVESTGANLILGDWVPVERKLNGYALTEDLALNAADVGALDTEKGGTVKAPVFFVDNKKYISTAGNTLYIASLLGKVILEGTTSPMARIDGKDYEIIHTGNFPKTDLSGYVPTTRKVNNKALSQDISLSSDDVNAVGKTGAQTMTGQLNGVKFTVTDAYALISRLRAQHGIFIGNNANDKRTIIGGGGDEVGDASGTVIIRPNGITDTAGATTFNPDGTITNGAEPVAGSHLTNKTYVDKVVKVVNDLFGNYLPLLGGTLKGAVLAHAIKSAIKVNNQASISFQDASSTMFHLFGEGNALRLRHGNNGENGIVSFYGNQVDIHQSMYVRTATVVQNSTKTRWLAMETPETGNPYLSARAQGEDGPLQVMEFHKDRIRSRKMLHADSMQVQADAGLRFAPTDDWSGTTWGMGINAENRNFGLHRYSDGVWQGVPLQITPANAVLVNSLVVNGGSESQYHQIRNSGNPSLELHEPGKHAVMAYKPQGTGTLRFCRSNGGGGEALGYGEVDADGFKTVAGRFRANYQAADRAWTGVGQNAFNLHQVNVASGNFVGIVGAQLAYAGKWGLEFGYGTYTNASPDLCGHIFNSTDGSGYHRKWQLRNDGLLETPSGWYISQNGDLWSPRLQTTVVDWSIATFSQKDHSHDAAKGNWSVVQGRHSEIGTYIMAALAPNTYVGAGINPGYQVAGQYLHPANCSEWGQNRGWAFSGTWMCMGHVTDQHDDRWDDRTTLWFRVA